MRLNRVGIFLLGVAIIYTYYFYNRLAIIVTSTKAQGEIIDRAEAQESWANELTHATCARVLHPDFGYLYADNPDEGLHIGDTVDVLYNRQSPAICHVYNGYAFWLRWLMYTIIPMLLWSSFALGYVHPKKVITIKLPKF